MGDGEAFGAQCGAASEATSGVCLPECEASTDCGAEQRCVDAKCVLEPSDATATCPDGSDGSRFGDQSPNLTDTYLQDCENPLSWEYYRVFETELGTAYIYPVPAGSQTLIEACQRETPEIMPILSEYGICESSDESATNAMAPEDALALAHYLHQNLVFSPSAIGVSPWAMAADIYQICIAEPAFAEGVMSERCAFEINAVETGARTEQGWTFTSEKALSVRLTWSWSAQRCTRSPAWQAWWTAWMESAKR